MVNKNDGGSTDENRSEEEMVIRILKCEGKFVSLYQLLKTLECIVNRGYMSLDQPRGW